MLVAGEASGDQHAARLVVEMQRLRPQDRHIGMGMSAMHTAGVELLVDAGSMAVTGLAEVVRHYPHIHKNLRRLRTALQSERPDLLILVDYPDFNLLLAKTARRLGVDTVFYISPQVWAWRRRRIRRIARLVNAMIVILPFEQQLYQHSGLQTHYFGHPLIDELTATGLLPCSPKRQLRPEQPRRILLLPGSRDNEVQRHLPIMAAAAAAMQQKYPQWRFSLLAADGLAISDFERHFAHENLRCEIVRDIHAALSLSDFAIACSGTVTLQLALCQVPMIVVYKLNVLTYWLSKLLVRIEFISLPNIILKQAVIAELVQKDLTLAAICRETYAVLEHPEHWHALHCRLADIGRQLGTVGVSERIAACINRMLESDQA